MKTTKLNQPWGYIEGISHDLLNANCVRGVPYSVHAPCWVPGAYLDSTRIGASNENTAARLR